MIDSCNKSKNEYFKFYSYEHGNNYFDYPFCNYLRLCGAVYNHQS